MTEPWWLATPSHGPRRARSRAASRSTRTRGAVARTWWSKRFLAVLEQLGVGGRLARGRSYARAGQIISLDVDGGRRGARRCRAAGRGRTPCGSGCRRSARPNGRGRRRRWSPMPSLAAALLAGEMPHEIEDGVRPVGLSLFPASARDLAIDCTLPRPRRALQAPGRGLLRAGRAVRRRPVRDAGAARARPRHRCSTTSRARRAQPAGPRPAGARRPAGRGAGASTPRAPCPRSRPAADTPSDALLDQVPPFPIEIRGIPVTELLRPAYRALGGA